MPAIEVNTLKVTFVAPVGPSIKVTTNVILAAAAPSEGSTTRRGGAEMAPRSRIALTSRREKTKTARGIYISPCGFQVAI